MQMFRLASAQATEGLCLTFPKPSTYSNTAKKRGASQQLAYGGSVHVYSEILPSDLVIRIRGNLDPDLAAILKAIYLSDEESFLFADDSGKLYRVVMIDLTDDAVPGILVPYTAELRVLEVVYDVSNFTG